MFDVSDDDDDIFMGNQRKIICQVWLFVPVYSSLQELQQRTPTSMRPMIYDCTCKTAEVNYLSQFV